MRGDLTDLTFEETVEWGRKAVAALSGGERPTTRTMRSALRRVDAPFSSVDSVVCKFGGSCRDWIQAVLRNVGTSTQKPMVRIGEGVSTNAATTHNWEDSWARLTNAYEDRKRAQENEVDRSVTIEAKGPVAVLVLGDMHIGSPSVDYPRLLWVAEQMNRKDIPVFAVFVGDVVDAMIWNSVKYEGRASPISVHKEVLTAIGWMEQANRLGHMIGGVCGNHDLVSEKMAGLSHFLLAMEQSQSRVPIAKNELCLAVHVREKKAEGQTYRWEIRHATKGNSIYQRGAGPIRHNRNNHRDTEILVAGHLHKSAHYEEERHGKKRYSIQVGAYKVAELDDYAVENGFERGDNEADFGVILWPDKHRIEVHKTDVAIERLEALHGHTQRSRHAQVVRVPKVAHHKRRRRVD